MGISDLAARLVGDKKRWKAYTHRRDALPAPYRTTAAGIERYLMNTGPADGANLMPMLEDLADLMEQSAASGTPVRDVVGEDPVEFTETFMANYGVASWIAKEQSRLRESIRRAEDGEGAAT